MLHTVTLKIPDDAYKRLLREAKRTGSTPEELLTDWVTNVPFLPAERINADKSSLPSLEDLPSELIEDLNALERLTKEELRQVMLSQVPAAQQRRLSRLLHKNQAGTLKAREREELSTLQKEADRVMLRKAHAAVLLKRRGERVPTLEEMQKLSRSK